MIYNAPKSHYNDKVKYLMNNYEDKALNVVPENIHGFGSSYSMDPENGHKIVWKKTWLH